MPNALIHAPIVPAAASYVLRVQTFGGAATDLTINLTAGRYYWPIGDGQADASTNGGVGDLLAILQTALAAHLASTTVALSAGLRVTITAGSGTLRILWAHANTTLPAAWFGFADADTAYFASTTGDYYPQHLWRPNKPVAYPDTRDQRVLIGGISRSLSGRVRVSNFGEPPRQRSLRFEKLLQAVVLDEYAEATALYSTWEQTWHDGIGLGRPFRLYDDEGSRGTSDFTLYTVNNLANPLDRDEGTRLRWRVDLQVVRYA